MEIRIHGRGGQGGVTCAKLLAAVYGRLGKSVQAFGDYAGERSGAPVRAYVRVSDGAITNRNKVYRPDHLLVLDPTLLGAGTLAGLAPGGWLLVNTPEAPDRLAPTAPAFRWASVDATGIARRHGIGTRSVVIVNTTVAGAYARALDLPFSALEDAYRDLGLEGNLPAAREAWEAVVLGAAPAASATPESAGAPTPAPAERPPVLDLVAHHQGPAPTLATGTWRSQTPRYVRHLSPCNAVCPAGNDVEGFIQALANDGEEAAAEVLSRTTPLAGVCGRVCPAPCVQGCNRRGLDGAVQVRGLERWVADRVPIARLSTRPGAAAPRQARRVAVVGSGPAGLSAAYSLLRQGHRVSLFDAAPELGGLLRYGIPRYRLPREVLEAEVRALLELGVSAIPGRPLGPAEIEDLAGEYDGVILAAGQQVRRGLGLPKPSPEGSLDGIEQGLDFLARVAAVGDLAADSGPALTGHVVILGGGNTAVDCARTALRSGAEHVTIAYRRGRAEMPAIPEEVEEAAEEGVEILFLRAPAAFRGDGRVTGVELAEMRLGAPDASGRRRPEPTGDTTLLPCDRVLLALGQSSDQELLPRGWVLEDGVAWHEGATLPVVAAGDYVTEDGTVAHAIGDGHRTARVLLSLLGEPVDAWRRPSSAERAAAVPADRIRFEHFAHASPAGLRLRPATERRTDWSPVSLGLANPYEARRCFACGDCTGCDTCLVYCPEGAIFRGGEAYVIDYDTCKGCGLCVTECPRDGMEMEDPWASI